MQHFSSDNMLRSFWRAASLNKKKFTSGNILLTGATGFVGAFILHKLLQTQVPNYYIYNCLLLIL